MGTVSDHRVFAARRSLRRSRMKTYRYHGFDERGFYVGGTFTCGSDTAIECAHAARSYGWKRLDVFEIDDEGVPVVLVTSF